MKINTKFLMTSSAVLLAVIGLFLSFLTTETASYFQFATTGIASVFFQILGALYFAFAMLNWMTKDNVMGGIYNRPIAVANLTHFLIGGLALLKNLIRHPDLPQIIWLLAGMYAVFAILFGMIFFRSPVANKK